MSTQYPLEQRIKIVELYLAYNSVIQVQYNVRCYRLQRPPTRKTMLRLMDKWKTTGNILNQCKNNSGRQRTARNEENTQRLRESLLQPPQQSTRGLSQIIDVSQYSVQRMIKNDLNLFPYLKSFTWISEKKISRRPADFFENWLPLAPIQPRFESKWLLSLGLPQKPGIS